MNIMDVLTPKPSFNPKRKNNAVKFNKPIHVTTNKAKKL